ncbi:hypothetical protein GCM10027294_33260 [Marinactinospora endophytica]
MLKKTFAAGAIAAAAAGVLFAAAPASADEVETSGAGGVLSGNQLVVDANVPVNVCGVSVAVLGISSAECEESGAVVVEKDIDKD